LRNNWVATGATFALTAVVLGAFAAHALEKNLTSHLLDVFKTGAYYQMVHALALMFVGQRMEARRQNGPLRAACILFTVGIVVFSGSLYLLASTGQLRLGAITPLGGLCFIAGWCCVILGEIGPSIHSDD